MANRAPFYRIVFTLAALYNLGFGLWAGFSPDSFFQIFEMRAPVYPAIWACLGMVVGTYALGYGYAALRLDRAVPFIAIGLVGKVLGPIGWLVTVRSGEWPAGTFPLVLFNDIVWWLPFTLFLIDATRLGARLRASAATTCAALNAVAMVAMALWLRGGTEIVRDPSARAAYIVTHLALWRAGWAIWIAAALALLAFYAWWGSRLGVPAVAAAAFVIALVGLVCDLGAESLFIGWLPEHLETLPALQRVGSLLTGGAANGLYSVAGAILTLKTTGMPAWLRYWAWATWTAGFLLTLCTLADSTAGIAVSTTVLMALFCPWAALLGRALR